MFYYAQYDTTSYAVTNVTPSETAITAEGYVQITEEQYNSGLSGLYYNPITGAFDEQRGWVCDTTYIQYKTTNANIEEKLDAMDEAIDGKAEANHTHTEYATSEALAGKADSDHTHTEYAPTSHNHNSVYAPISHEHTEYATSDDVNTAVAGKADSNHTHSQYATTTALTSALVGKANANHTHTGYAATSHTHDNYALAEDVEDLETTVNGKANASHTHAQTDITGLSTALAGKANTSHTHTDYATVSEVEALETTVNGKANASHTHAQTDITGLSTALAGKANTSHTHNDYALATDLAGLSDTVSGKANASHNHTLDNITETTAKKIMTAAERTKLSGIAEGANKTTVDSAMSSTSTNPVQNKVVNTALGNKVDKVSGKGLSTNDYTTTEKNKLAGIAEGANNYTHPTTHPASMISGLAGVATSGSYNDLSNKPTSMTPTAHNHAQSDISGLETALAGKASSSHTHTAAQVGAAASSHNHDSAYISKDLLFTNVEGGVEYSYGSGSGKNVLTEISNMPQGFHTIYAIAGTTGNPETAESYRYFIHKTSTTIGWIYAFGADGSIYSNYLAGANTYKGWKTIHDAKRKPLWTGTRYMTADHTVTPSKKLSACEHGWMLLWSDYDPDTGTVNNTDFCTNIIPNRNWTGGNWSGQAYYCDCPRYTAGTATDSESRVIKVLNVYDNKLVGVANNNAAPRNDVVLRAVYEF